MPWATPGRSGRARRPWGIYLWAELMVRSLFQEPGWAFQGGRWSQLEHTQDPLPGEEL